MIVQEANGQITSYNLDAVLRLGVFAIISPVVKDGFVLLQAMLIAILSGCMCAGLLTLHGAGIFPVRSSSVRPSKKRVYPPVRLPNLRSPAPPSTPIQRTTRLKATPDLKDKSAMAFIYFGGTLSFLFSYVRDSNLTHFTAFWRMHLLLHQPRFIDSNLIRSP